MTRRRRELREGNCHHFRPRNDDDDDDEEEEGGSLLMATASFPVAQPSPKKVHTCTPSSAIVSEPDVL